MSVALNPLQFGSIPGDKGTQAPGIRGSVQKLVDRLPVGADVATDVIDLGSQVGAALVDSSRQVAGSAAEGLERRVKVTLKRTVDNGLRWVQNMCLSAAMLSGGTAVTSAAVTQVADRTPGASETVRDVSKGVGWAGTVLGTAGCGLGLSGAGAARVLRRPKAANNPTV